MARGINKVILVGNLGADPETRYTANGSAVANVRIATTEVWRDKQSGDQQERTEWHRVVFFGRLAEIVSEYLRKGSQVYVEGRLQTRKWQGQDGQDRWTTEVVANDMQMLGGRGGGAGASAPAPDMDEPWEPESAAGESTASASRGGGRGARKTEPAQDFDDDIPF